MGMTGYSGAVSGGRMLNEFERIERYLAPLASELQGARGLKDDAAILSPTPGMDLVVTVDALVEDVHFLPSDPPSDIARKALRVNLSDLAAKGAVPNAYLLTLALPERADDHWLADFCAGLAEDQARFGTHLAGGDSVSTAGPLTISITALGEVPAGTAPDRSGARPGDDIYVSGTIGDGYLGLLAATGRLFGEHSDYLIGRYRLPRPRLDLGRAIAPHVTAMMDVSDGLIGDLNHIAAASGVGAIVRGPALPLSAAAVDWLVDGPDGLSDLVCGGDDYELLATAPPDARKRLSELAAAVGVRLSRIGSVGADAGSVSLVDAAGEPVPIPVPGYRHR